MWIVDPQTGALWIKLAFPFTGPMLPNAKITTMGGKILNITDETTSVAAEQMNPRLLSWIFIQQNIT